MVRTVPGEAAWNSRGVPVQCSLLVNLLLRMPDVHQAHPGVPAQLLHALAELQLVEARRNVGLALGLQPAQLKHG